ncbi:caspase-3-like [Lingula anatina]|uniref:Caspase-3-like n=1 Tax=Lingula anatina TaxID=7574 RepID=A0A1S3JEV3_LINAN|nr:caspase-3-like [Lingula anatina]XP_013408946.1 caspase-3-like [Lingula anatina]XP_013408947.1 caspase-3-like [Lingula anatina]|eukprot:XP_013408945.1 caspase-3-like [Lingula anatina]
MASSAGIHSLLAIRLKKEITEDQLELIKHRFTSKIGAGRIENMDTLDLLNELNNRMIISKGKYNKLRQVFKEVGLEKLNRHLDKAEQRIQNIKSGKANGKNEVKEDLSSSESDEGACGGSEEQTEESWSGDEILRVAPEAGRPQQVGSSGDHDMEYPMTYENRGLAVIFNNCNFASHTGMAERRGTDQDANGIENRLRALGFDVNRFDNVTCSRMSMTMAEVGRRNHSQNDCVALVILSHGEEGKVYGTDGIIEVDQLLAPLKGDRCLTLAGKPKLIFIQACRGTKLDGGVEVADAEMWEDEPDGRTHVHRIPAEADFLIAYSVVPGFFSWRNSMNGSWFMQALIQVLGDCGQQLDILSLMTIVNKKVAYEFESNAASKAMSKKKQVLCITSMLTKLVYFRPKH